MLPNTWDRGSGESLDEADDEANDEADESSDSETLRSCLCAIRVYPNPVSHTLYIEIPEKTVSTFDIRLYDNQGKLRRHTTAKGGPVQLDVARLRAGNYFLHIHDGVGERPDVRQIVVEH